MGFVISPDDDAIGDYVGYLGVPTGAFAVEFDTQMDVEFENLNGNHVGLDLSSMVSSNVVNLDLFGVDLRRMVFDVWVELVAPPETTRLVGAAGDFGADEGPISMSLLFHQFHEGGIFLWAPGTFDLPVGDTTTTTTAQWPEQHHQLPSSSLALPLFSSEPTSSSSTKPSPTFPKEMMQGYFSMGQWQELEVQALIYRHMLTVYQSGGGYWGRGGMDPEPGRCRRTDGKKWRCSKDVVGGHKYCERHIHRGRNRSRKPVEIPTPTTTTVAGTRDYKKSTTTSAAHPYTTTASADATDSAAALSAHSSFSDQLHLNQRMESTVDNKATYRLSENDNKSSDGRILRPFFDDWPRTVHQQEMLATSLSISVQGDTPSDFSLKLSTGHGDTGSRGLESSREQERGRLSWGMQWGTHHAGSMGGPLAEALRSSSTSNSSSPTSVLHQLQRGSTTTSETSYVST
ncbi:hypothetical protein L6452_26182 [Arctium lappa]|uniref:Uncharacterized protein n=1 Tax=Arctium lappa TaxID=4217 RepID=A0ACB9AC34_ARCLA|nr:hypothetical protein L6452_26182 [Arctium lappa]